MKARKLIKRDRTTRGRATGFLICRLKFPEIDEVYEWGRRLNNPVRTVNSIRRFVERYLSENNTFLTDSNFVISAEIRISQSRLGRQPLARWKFGDDFTSVFEKALQEYELLEPEEDYIEVEVDLEL
jgi:hypothetical protein